MLLRYATSKITALNKAFYRKTFVGKGEVESSILSGSTSFQRDRNSVQQAPRGCLA